MEVNYNLSDSGQMDCVHQCVSVYHLSHMHTPPPPPPHTHTHIHTHSLQHMETQVT